MPFQVTTETPHTSLQVGGGVTLSFLKKEKLYVSQAVKREVAELTAKIKGFLSREVSDAEAQAHDAAIAESKKAVAQIEDGAKIAAQKAAASLTDSLKTAVIHATALAEAKAQSAIEVTLDAAAHGNLKRVVDLVASVTGINLTAQAVGNTEGPVAMLTNPDSTRNTPAVTVTAPTVTVTAPAVTAPAVAAPAVAAPAVDTAKPSSDKPSPDKGNTQAPSVKK